MNSIAAALRDYLHTQYPASHAHDFDNDDSLLALGVIDLFGLIDLMAFLERHYFVFFDDGAFIPAELDSIHKLAAAAEARLLVSPLET